VIVLFRHRCLVWYIWSNTCHCEYIAVSWSWTVSKYKVPKLKNLYKVTLLAVVLDLANKKLSYAAVVKIATNFSFNCFETSWW